MTNEDSLIHATWASGPPGFHTTTQELQTCTFDCPGFEKHQHNSTRHPERGTRTKWLPGEGKKSEILGPATLRGPTLPTFSGFGAAPFGPPHVFFVPCTFYFVLNTFVFFVPTAVCFILSGFRLFCLDLPALTQRGRGGSTTVEIGWCGVPNLSWEKCQRCTYAHIRRHFAHKSKFVLCPLLSPSWCRRLSRWSAQQNVFPRPS